MNAAVADIVPPPLRVIEKPSPLSDRDLLTLALEALKTEPNLFTRDNRLIEVVLSPRPEIIPLDRYTLRERLLSNERWRQTLADQKIRRTPAWLEMQLLRRREWPGVRPLKGLIHAPMLRADGSVISERGFDEATGLYLTASMPLRLPETLTKDDAKQAYHRLATFAKQLPLQSGHRAAFIASLLTPLARLAFDGAAPLFLFDSPTDRAPSMLADAVSLIVCGKPITQLDKPPSERVFRRRLAQAELHDETLILLEGAGSYRSAEALKTGLFNRAWVDGDKRSRESNPVTWYAAGRNVSLTQDVASLVVPIRALATEEEDGRPLWTPPPSFEQSVLRERSELIAAALTLLRAYLVAGRPAQEVGTFPRFEAWSALVPSALVWAESRNPLETRKSLCEYVEDDSVELKTLITTFSLIPRETQGFTVQDLIFFLNSEHPTLKPLKEVLEALAPGGEWRKPRKLGALLKKVRDRRVEGYFIARIGTDRKGYARWAPCVDSRSPPEAQAGASPLQENAESQEAIHATREGTGAESRESLHATGDQSRPKAGGSERQHERGQPGNDQMPNQTC